MSDWKKEIEKLEGSFSFLWDSDLSSYNSMRLQCKGNILLVENSPTLQEILTVLKKHQVQYNIIGWGANFALPPEVPGVLIKLKYSQDLKLFEEFRPEYWLASSVGLNNLTRLASRLELGGWERMSGIPASLGGAIAMNAGTALGEISELCTQVKVLTSQGEEKIYSVSADDFSYRKNLFLGPGEIIIEVALKPLGRDPEVKTKIKEYLNYRNQTQPMDQKTFGCTFKNLKCQKGAEISICRAGQTIDILGLKGFEMNGLKVSPKHANFIENHANADLNDLRGLIKHINDECEKKKGIRFETEIHFLNKENS